MIRTAAALVVILLTTSALAAERNYPVGGFDRISLGGSPEVTVTTGRTPGVRATGEQKALDRLEIEVVNGTLRIGSKRGVNWGWDPSEMVKVRVAVTVPMVRGVSVGGSGTVMVDRVKVPAFAADVGGSGSIKLASLETGSASFSVGGSGDVVAAGRCGSSHANVGGSGSLKLGDLRCDTLDVSLAGSGDVEANASRTAAISVAGSGDVHVAGGAKCTISKVGSGQARCTA